METQKLKTSKNVSLAFKLNGKNYPLWSRLMKIAIGSRGAVSHIRDKPLTESDKGYQQWEETDLVVFSWIVDNIEDDIIADFAHHQSAKAIWDNLAITYESKADPYAVYDLEERASSIKQGDMDLENYYRKIHGIWINIDRCQKQPVKCCDKGVEEFREYTNQRRLFKFLAGLNSNYESIRRDILKEDPLPSVETAYGIVKREATRRHIMPSETVTLEPTQGEIGYGYAA